MKSMVKCICAMIVVLLLSIPSNALATHYTMDFDGTGLQWTNSYAEDGFLITAVDSGSGVDGFFVGSERLWKVNPSRSEELLFTHFDDAHNDLAFDLVSLDIDLLWGESIITSSSGASLSLSDFGLGTAIFNSLGWLNITSFSIENSGIFAIDNIVLEMTRQQLQLCLNRVPLFSSVVVWLGLHFSLVGKRTVSLGLRF